MAEKRSAARRGNRLSRRLSAVSGSGKKNNYSRRSLVEPRPTVLPNPDNDTPRIMLKRIIQTQPQVSPLALQISKHEGAEEAQAEVPSKRVSSMGGIQLPDLLPEDTQVTTFHMAKKKKKFSISEFERAADKRLPQNQARSTLDSTALARSLRVSVGSLVPADLAEEQGLRRRPKQRRAIDLEAFEAGVEQNMLNRKAQSHLVDSQLGMHTSDAEIMLSTTRLFVQPQLHEQSQNKLSPLQLSLLDSKTSWRSKKSGAAQEEVRSVGLVSSMSTNERQLQWHSEDLSLDPEHGDRATPKPASDQQEDQQDPSQQSNPVEQLSLSEEVVAVSVNRWSSSSPSSSRECLGSPLSLKHKSSFSMALREVVSHIIEDLDVSDAEELAGAVTPVQQEHMCREAAEHHACAGSSEHLGNRLSKAAESQLAAAQDARAEMEAASGEDEEIAEGVENQGSPEAAPELEMTTGGGAGSLGRPSLAPFSAKPGMKPLKEAVEQADKLEDQAIMVELDSLEEESAVDEAEDPESEEVSLRTPSFVRAAAYKPQLSAPLPARPAAPKLSAPRPAKPSASRSPLQLLQAKLVAKSSGVSRRRPREAGIVSSWVKKVFSHYAKMPVTREAFRIVEKCSERYFKQLSNDLEAYANHAGRKTVEMADLEVLMRRQGLVTDRVPMQVLIEHHLPLEYRKLLIPVAMSGNKVIPCL